MEAVAASILRVGHQGQKGSGGGRRAAPQGGAGAGDREARYNFLHLRMENDWVEHCK